MPAQQRRWRHDERSPACTRQEPAGRRQEEPVGPRHRRTAGSSPEDGEFVPKHDDFQVFEVVRSNVQDSELKNPPKNDVQAGQGGRADHGTHQGGHDDERLHASARRRGSLGSGSRRIRIVQSCSDPGWIDGANPLMSGSPHWTLSATG